jgi:hypothetical protein
VSRDVHSIKCCNSWCYAKRWLCGDCVEERRIEVVISLSPVLCFAFAQTATLTLRCRAKFRPHHL